MFEREIKNVELHLAANGFSLDGPKPKGRMATVWKEGKKLIKKQRRKANGRVRGPKQKVKRKAKPKKVDFYTSEEWRSLRYKALELSDGCCCLCGRSRKHGVILHVDHIKPRSIYPSLELDLDNLQVLCEDCNLGKSNRSTRDWR